MSVSEILAELEKLSTDDLRAVRQKLDLLSENSGETPEMLAAIDEGLRSLREEGAIPIEEVRERMKSWNFKSS